MYIYIHITLHILIQLKAKINGIPTVAGVNSECYFWPGGSKPSQDTTSLCPQRWGNDGTVSGGLRWCPFLVKRDRDQPSFHFVNLTYQGFWLKHLKWIWTASPTTSVDSAYSIILRLHRHSRTWDQTPVSSTKRDDNKTSKREPLLQHRA